MLDFTKQPQPPNPPYELEQAPSLALTSEATFFGKIYSWMFGGLLTTALVAYYLASSAAWINALATSRFLFIFIALVQLGLVFTMSMMINKLSSAALKAMFLFYAVTLGMTMSIFVKFYPSQVIFKAFFSAAAVYGAMAAYGLVTKRSLQAWGSFLFMGLVGIIIASLVNIFLGSSALDFVICWIGVIIFAGLTAYDHQKLRVIHAGGFGDSEAEGKVVIMGALNLYLDFVNLFLFLLRLFGGNSD
ncbi:MAG: Bax inhibitor-1/YccA family protein [Deltaproteobacteria bacterium]|jgi:FtsH-binding integral membrane protein|nr:Bax inhibitor-1/YccA family protein [Deltaproteobacteria bacterium]